MVVEKEFIETAHRIVWCTVATVDRQGRPRSRILHPYWEYDGTSLTGWIVTRPTPVKVSHLARTPYVSCSYWDPSQDVAVADCHAEWVGDVATRQRVWELYRAAAQPLGFDFWSVFPDGPAGETVSLLRLTPYRLRITDVDTLSGRKAPLTWP
jgi:general stress protein 26